MFVYLFSLAEGYTSISVREPLANIIAQTNQQQAAQRKRKELSDSHYATVSDDSDEMYAAIEDPNHQGDLYTSGSETYAQIQPPANNQLTVSVEINTSPLPPTPTIDNPNPPNHLSTTVATTTATTTSTSTQIALHSRQASASSCTSSLGYIGSPKPEKRRQANSPLPPTPKSTQKSNNSSSTLTSGRNSSASVIEVSGVIGIGKMDGKGSTSTIGSPHSNKSSVSNSIATGVKKSPSKDIEEMYAKVMKKTKLFSTPSNANSINDLQNNNPEIFTSDPEIAKEIPLDVGASPGKNSTKSVQLDNNYETIDKKRIRSSSFTNKDPGYETIPAVKIRENSTKDTASAAQPKSRMSAPVSLEPGYETLPDNRTINAQIVDPGYETLKRDSDYDPNYEVLRPKSERKSRNDGTSDLGVYPLDGHGYARIAEKLNNNIEDDASDIYSSIPSTSVCDAAGYSTIKDPKENGGIPKTLLTPNLSKLSECSSLTGSDTDPNYESVRYLKNENPYERLQSTSPSPIAENKQPLVSLEKQKDTVTDYFQV